MAGPTPLDKAEIEAILTAVSARQRRSRLRFTLLYETGMRVGEALALYSTDVHLNDLDGGYLRILGKGGRTGGAGQVHE
jgi:site-specific recombinase XerD